MSVSFPHCHAVIVRLSTFPTPITTATFKAKRGGVDTPTKQHNNVVALQITGKILKGAYNNSNQKGGSPNHNTHVSLAL